jgi:type II secretory pathway pseudopilin PulG
MKERKVKPIAKQSNRKAAFTIVELLTVMSIIIILMGLLAPAMNRVRRFARRVSQKNQFHSIEVALELFRSEFDGYPDSGALDGSTPAGGIPYCGAMKLAEAMMGQDLLGFHPDSRFRSDGMGGGTLPVPLYAPATERQRKEYVYLPLEQANAYRLSDIYTNAEPPFEADRFVLCDVYTRTTNLTTGKRIGMPILYFKANTSNARHDPMDLPLPGNDKGQVYNYLDNDELVKLGMPWNPTAAHPIASMGTTPEGVAADPSIFYQNIWNAKIPLPAVKPYRLDSFILMSAGFDGEYGTPDDVFNFEKE